MIPLAITAFLVGLAGGVHCAAMCGGIVAALNLRRPGTVSPAASPPMSPGPITLGGSLSRQLAYSLGRATTYTVMGAVAGGAGSLGLLYKGVLPAQVLFLVVANGLIILLGLYLAGLGTSVLVLERAGGFLWRGVRRLGARIVPAKTVPRAVAMGLTWGCIPCGLVYSVLATALVAGTALKGAAVMAAFGLGTMPNLLGLGLLAQNLRRFLQKPQARRIAGFAVILLGLIGLVRIPELREHIRHGMHAMH